MARTRCGRACFHTLTSVFTLVAIFYVMATLSLYQLEHRKIQATVATLHTERTDHTKGKDQSSRVDYRNQEDEEIIFPDQDAGDGKEADDHTNSKSDHKNGQLTSATDYTNPLVDGFCEAFNKHFKKHNKLFVSLQEDENFPSFVERLQDNQKEGRKLLSPNKREKDGTPWRQFYHEISQYALYDPSSFTVSKVLENLRKQPVTNIANFNRGTQTKLLLTFKDGGMAIFKPMRVPRDQETLPDHFYFNDFERHNAEIAAFHLDRLTFQRLLGFYRVPPTVGRVFSIESDFNDFENTSLEENVYYSPAENRCFYAKCEMYCDSNHPICGNPDTIEASLAILLPGRNKAKRQEEHNPWQRSYSKTMLSPWQIDNKFCETARKEKVFKQGRRLLDTIDTHIFDFLTGNMDRHSLEMYTAFGGDTFPIWFDNGRGFGKSKQDIYSILAPLEQCCQIRLSTLAKLVKLYTGTEKLSHLMRASLTEDPLEKLLTEPHLDAFDRRVVHILTMVRGCVEKAGGFKNVVTDDGHM